MLGAALGAALYWPDQIPITEGGEGPATRLQDVPQERTNRKSDNSVHCLRNRRSIFRRGKVKGLQ
jgi:hypothetical protein